MPRASRGNVRGRDEEIELLRAQLDSSQLKHRVAELEAAVRALEAELKESNSLLLKSRHMCKRPFLSSIDKQLCAARQNWMCASGEACPLRTLTPNNTFDDSLWVVDHKTPYSQCGKHRSQLQALCVHCDSRKTRIEISTRQHRRPIESNAESDADDDDIDEGLEHA